MVDFIIDLAKVTERGLTADQLREEMEAEAAGEVETEKPAKKKAVKKKAAKKKTAKAGEEAKSKKTPAKKTTGESS